MQQNGRSRAGMASIVFGLALAAGHVPPAWARSEKTFAYPREQAWPTAVRFLVVDEHVKITEKDADAGYVVFELRDEGKTFRGALELVTLVRDGRSEVKFVLQIEDRPSWLEIAMLRRLEAKLQVELGSPAPAPSRPPPANDDKKDDRKKDDKPAQPPSSSDDLPLSPTP